MKHREIERKFLVSGSSYRGLATRVMHIRQAYIGHAWEGEARVSIRDDKAWIIIKSANKNGLEFKINKIVLLGSAGIKHKLKFNKKVKHYIK